MNGILPNLSSRLERIVIWEREREREDKAKLTSIHLLHREPPAPNGNRLIVHRKTESLKISFASTLRLPAAHQGPHMSGHVLRTYLRWWEAASTETQPTMAVVTLQPQRVPANYENTDESLVIVCTLGGDRVATKVDVTRRCSFVLCTPGSVHRIPICRRRGPRCRSARKPTYSYLQPITLNDLCT